MEENTFWVCLWGIGGAVFITLILSVTYYCHFEASLVSKAIEAGNDPISAACAFNNQSLSVCGMAAAKMKPVVN